VKESSTKKITTRIPFKKSNPMIYEYPKTSLYNFPKVFVHAFFRACSQDREWASFFQKKLSSSLCGQVVSKFTLQGLKKSRFLEGEIIHLGR